MKRWLRNVPVTTVALALLGSLVAWYVTRTTETASSKPASQVSRSSPVDQRMLQTARQIAALADTRDEQYLAREALRISDHELDLEFTTLLREAAEAPTPVSGPLKELEWQVDQLWPILKAAAE